MSNEVCKYCKFYQAKEGAGDGQCHRYPPIFSVSGGTSIVYYDHEPKGSEGDIDSKACFPDVCEQAWCGEFRGKEGA